jgi:hypothetical protein
MGMIQINGRTFDFPNGANISVINGRIMVNGETIHLDNKPIIVEVTGDVNILRTDNSATIKGNVLGSVEAGNSVQCGDIYGDVEAGNTVHAKSISGDVEAGNSIKIYKN